MTLGLVSTISDPNSIHMPITRQGAMVDDDDEDDDDDDEDNNDNDRYHDNNGGDENKRFNVE